MNRAPKRKVASKPATISLKAVLALVRAVSFQAVTFYDEKQERQIIVLYALGSDGILREFSSGKWTPFPIEG